jgi:hypothetical protein
MLKIPSIFAKQTSLLCPDMCLYQVTHAVLQNTTHPGDELSFVGAAELREISMNFQTSLLHDIRRIDAGRQDTIQVSASKDPQQRSVFLEQNPEGLRVALERLSKHIRPGLFCHRSSLSVAKIQVRRGAEKTWKTGFKKGSREFPCEKPNGGPLL